MLLNSVEVPVNEVVGEVNSKAQVGFSRKKTRSESELTCNVLATYGKQVPS